ncbi:MAG: GmrSD restriction endonuclease domain-containing protein [Methanomicrobiales archaeon]
MERQRRVSLVRAGRKGEDEEFCLNNDLAMIGFREVPSLESVNNYDSIWKVVQESYPNQKPRKIGNYAGQLGSFTIWMNEGDIIVLPRKLTSQVALGIVTGPYQYRKIGEDYRHTRPVKWIRKDIPRTDFAQDLLNSIGSALTVCCISRNEAKKRIEVILNGEPDPALSDADFREKITKTAIEIDLKLENASVLELLNDSNIHSYHFDSHQESIKHPEKVTIKEIIRNCYKGMWVLPRFQRYFSWKNDDIQSFLDAIFHNHYVGSFLIWNVGKDTELDTQSIKGLKQTPGTNPHSIILDGQQRITSLIYSIFLPRFDGFDHPEKWDTTAIAKEHPVYYYFNFKEFFKNPKSSDIIFSFSKKLEKDLCFEYSLFPLYELNNISEWTFEFEEYLRSTSSDYKKAHAVRNIIEKKLNFIWEKFEIPYVILDSSMQLDQVTDIFLGVNTKGVPLGLFDILIAKFYKNNIDFKALWEKTLVKYPNIKRYNEVYSKENKFSIYILQAISLYHDDNNSAKRADILNIYSNLFEKSNLNFLDEWNQFASLVNDAIDRLENLKESGFGVRSARDIPYAPTIPIIAALLKVIENRENKFQNNKKLAQWYWSSIFTVAYSSAVESQLSSDYKAMREWFNDDKKIPKSVGKLMKEIENIDFSSISSESNVIYRGAMSLIALAGAKDFDTGLTLEISRKNDKDHIFPKSNPSFSTHPGINSVLNMTWNSAPTNQKIKRAKSPSVYIQEFISEKYGGDESNFYKILESHLVNKKAFEYLKNDNFNGFLNEREKILKQKIKEILEISTSDVSKSLISPLTPYTNKILLQNSIRRCEGSLKWIDKYFSKVGLEILIDVADKDRISEIRILMDVGKMNEKMRDEFKKFNIELHNKGITSELRVIIDRETLRNIHDRWILADNIAYNIPSTDVIGRGQYSEIHETVNRPPFDQWWEKGKNILSEWNEITRYLESKGTE